MTDKKTRIFAAFGVYEIATGRVLRSGSGAPGCESLMGDDPQTEDYLCLDAPVDPNAYVVVNGALVKKPEQN